MAQGTISADIDVAVARDDTELARATMRRVSVRLLPLIFVLYICNYIDRTNVAIAGLRMNADLHLSGRTYALGVGIFFVGYVLFEVPSNVILARVGARRWIARIMISWGLIAAAMMFMRTPLHFYVLRCLLGFAEAGFFPGIIYYLSAWFPAPQRARATSRFMIAIPLSIAIGSPLGVLLLGLNGRLGLAGWRWLFFVEGSISVLLGFAALMWLTERVEDAHWLSEEQREWLGARLRREADESAAPHSVPPLHTLLHLTMWLLAIPYLLINTALYGYAFWSPILIRDALHSSDLVTGLVAGAIACATVLVMIVFGVSSDRTGERCLHAAASAMLCAIGYVVAALLPSPWALVLGLTLASFGLVAVVLIFCLPSTVLRGTAAAAGIAFVNSIGSIGGFAGPYVIGLSKDRLGGTSGAFLVLAALALGAAMVLLAVRFHSAFAMPSRVIAPSSSLSEA